MKELWLLKHRHQHEGPRKVGDGKLTTVIKDLLVQKLESKASDTMKKLLRARVEIRMFCHQSIDKRTPSTRHRRRGRFQQPSSVCVLRYRWDR